MEDVKSESAATSVIRSAKSSDLIRIAKSSRPEIVRAHLERNAVGGSARGENPSRFVRLKGSPQNRRFCRPLDRVHKQTNPGFLSCLSHSSDFQGLTTSRGDGFSACGGRRNVRR
jgi:hypothetical protein